MSDTKTETWAVLDDFERNGYHDSDFYEITWDGEKVAVVCTGSTAWAGRHFSGNLKATQDEDRAARATMGPLLLAQFTADAETEAKRPDVGRTVQSLTTRGKNVGVTGTIVRMIEHQFRTGAWRAQIELDDHSRVWMDADRLQITGGVAPINHEQLRELALRFAAGRSWRGIIGRLGWSR